MTVNADGQMSLFDHDTWCGKTCREPLAQTEVKTSESSLKKQRKLRTVTPLFLDLRKDKNGLLPEPSWEMGGLLLGEYTTRSFGECPNVAAESRLSQILEDNPHPKYCLSARACQGILNRAEKRGKELPPELKAALEQQCRFKNEPDVQGGGKGILIQNERTGALSTLNNQAVFESHGQDARYKPLGEVSETVSAKYGMGGNNTPIVIEGNGSRESHKGDGYKQSEVMYTLNTIEQHAVFDKSKLRGGVTKDCFLTHKDFAVGKKEI